MPAAALENRRLHPMGGQDISREVRHIMTRVDHHAGGVARAVALVLLAARAQQGLSRRLVEASCVPPFGRDVSPFKGKARRRISLTQARTCRRTSAVTRTRRTLTVAPRPRRVQSGP